MREVISLHLGQAGVQIGSHCWELYCLEHGLNDDGILTDKANFNNNARVCDLLSGVGEQNGIPDGFLSFFNETAIGKFTPRAVYIDLEPSVIDELKNGRFKELYAPINLVAGKEDAANNFARGFCSAGLKILPRAVDPITRMCELCDKLQGFVFTHSYGGGTGSGFYAQLLMHLNEEYPKSSKLEVAVFPSHKMSTAVVEPYNTVLVTDATIDKTECVFLVDNESLYELCLKKLDIESPTYTNLNRILAQAVSSITTSIRFKGTLNADFVDFKTNLVPYPRIHFPLISYAPIVGEANANHEVFTVSDITSKCFDPSNVMFQCKSSNGGKYMSCCLLYRGDVAPKDVNAAIMSIKTKKTLSFVDWSPTGFKIGINGCPPAYVPDGDLSNAKKAVCMLFNTTAVRNAWSSLNAKYVGMLRHRAFFHWYTGEGMDEREFYDAQQNLYTLEQEYQVMDEDS